MQWIMASAHRSGDPGPVWSGVRRCESQVHKTFEKWVSEIQMHVCTGALQPITVSAQAVKKHARVMMNGSL
eukprot:3132605-Amphidinium_carterae.2